MGGKPYFGPLRNKNRVCLLKKTRPQYLKQYPSNRNFRLKNKIFIKFADIVWKFKLYGGFLGNTYSSMGGFKG